MKTLLVEALAVPFWVLLPLVSLVNAVEVVVVHWPTRPWTPGFPGLGKVKESLDSMRCTEFMSGLSATLAWQHKSPS